MTARDLIGRLRVAWDFMSRGRSSAALRGPRRSRLPPAQALTIGLVVACGGLVSLDVLIWRAPIVLPESSHADNSSSPGDGEANVPQPQNDALDASASPLDAISRYAPIVDRLVFDPTRKVVDLPKAEPSPPPAPPSPPPKPLELTLEAIVVSGGERRALVRLKDGKDARWLSAGDQIEGRRVSAIAARSLEVAAPGDAPPDRFALFDFVRDAPPDPAQPGRSSGTAEGHARPDRRGSSSTSEIER